MRGLDIGAVVHWIGQYNDDNVGLTGSPKLNMPITGGPNNSVSLPFPRAQRGSVDYARLDRIVYIQPAPPAPAEVPGFAKDGGKNVKMKDGKEKNVMPVSTAEYSSMWMARLVE